MNFFKLLEILKGPDAALILYALLDRVPIIVYGDDDAMIDDFVIDLSNLIHFRKEFIFYTDFISMSEYDNLVMDESVDYNSQRTHIRCPSSVAQCPRCPDHGKHALQHSGRIHTVGRGRNARRVHPRRR